jgi:hypothetical protein
MERQGWEVAGSTLLLGSSTKLFRISVRGLVPHPQTGTGISMYRPWHGETRSGSAGHPPTRGLGNSRIGLLLGGA